MRAPYRRVRLGRLLSCSVIVALILAGATSPAQAGDEDDVSFVQASEPRVSQWMEESASRPAFWRAAVELGMLTTGGNSPTQTVQARGRLLYERERWRHTGRFGSLSVRERSTTTNEQHELLQKSAYRVSSASYVFELVRFFRNRFLGIQRRFIEGIGVGRRVVGRKGLTLDLEIGPGARQSLDTEGSRSAVPILLVAAELDWSPAKGLNFNEFLALERSERDTNARSQASLTMQVSGGLSLKLAGEVIHESNAPAGKEPTDTVFSATLLYTFSG